MVCFRNLGFSYHGDIEVYDYLLSRHDEFKWDFVQIQLNYVDWKHAKETNTRNTDAEYLYGELAKRGIPAIIMEPLLGGRLSKLNDNLVARLKQRRPESSVASWAFRFAGSFPDILTVLSGMTYMEHLQDNLRTYSPLEPLTDEEKEFLEETAQLMLKYPTIPCNDCKYCMPCPYGLDIPAVLLHYNRCVNEGNVARSGQDENYAKARRAFLVGYDRSVPKLRQASHCIGCNQCVAHCPQNIDIPKELHDPARRRGGFAVFGGVYRLVLIVHDKRRLPLSPAGDHGGGIVKGKRPRLGFDALERAGPSVAGGKFAHREKLDASGRGAARIGQNAGGDGGGVCGTHDVRIAGLWNRAS